MTTNRPTDQPTKPSDAEKLDQGQPAICCICGQPIDPRETWHPTPEGAAICATCASQAWK